MLVTRLQVAGWGSGLAPGPAAASAVGRQAATAARARGGAGARRLLRARYSGQLCGERARRAIRRHAGQRQLRVCARGRRAGARCVKVPEPPAPGPSLHLLVQGSRDVLAAKCMRPHPLAIRAGSRRGGVRGGAWGSSRGGVRGARRRARGAAGDPAGGRLRPAVPHARGRRVGRAAGAAAVHLRRAGHGAPAARRGAGAGAHRAVRSFLIHRF